MNELEITLWSLLLDGCNWEVTGIDRETLLLLAAFQAKVEHSLYSLAMSQYKRKHVNISLQSNNFSDRFSGVVQKLDGR